MSDNDVLPHDGVANEMLDVPDEARSDGSGEEGSGRAHGEGGGRFGDVRPMGTVGDRRWRRACMWPGEA